MSAQLFNLAASTTVTAHGYSKYLVILTNWLLLAKRYRTDSKKRDSPDGKLKSELRSKGERKNRKKECPV